MRAVQIGLIGLGNVGGGALDILTRNAEELSRKLGFPLNVRSACSRTAKDLPASVRWSANWRDVVNDPEIEVVAELVGGTTTAREIVEAALAAGKSVVTANKELMALAGPELWSKASAAKATIAMEASVCGGIPIHAVLREGIAADSIQIVFGILNGTSNYILSEIEANGTPFDDVLREAQRLGYAEADPTADVEGFDARSKLALLTALVFGVKLEPSQIATEGIRRIGPEDFAYAAQLGCTIKLLCSARRVEEGVWLSVRPALIPKSAILAGVRGAYNGVWVKGRFGQDTFYYGRGAGPLPTGVAVVSDLMRVARELRFGGAERVPPFAHVALEPARILPLTSLQQPWYLRFRVHDRPGIIASLAAILARHGISVDAVLQLPAANKADLPFVITVETTPEAAIRAALAEMSVLDFMATPPVALPMEGNL